VVYDPARMRLRFVGAWIAAIAWGPALATASPPADRAPSPAVARIEGFPLRTARGFESALLSFATDSSSPPLLSKPSGSTVARELAIAGAAAGAGFLLDPLVKPGSTNRTFAFRLGRALGGPYVLGGGLAAFTLYGWATDNEPDLRLAGRLAISMAATTATVELFKILYHRERPDRTDRHSFPSGHAANTFAVATVLDREYDGVGPWIGYGVATFVSFTRVYGARHWFSDVTAGAGMGRMYGRLAAEATE
jgi:membrane-associated phospholipid phosphatase